MFDACLTLVALAWASKHLSVPGTRQWLLTVSTLDSGHLPGLEL